MENTEEIVKGSGIFADWMPSWLMFTIIGVLVAVVVISLFSKKGRSFIGLVIIVVIVIIVLSSAGIIDFDKIFDKGEEIVEDISEGTSNEEIFENEEGSSFELNYPALFKIKEGFSELFRKKSE